MQPNIQYWYLIMNHYIDEDQYNIKMTDSYKNR